MGWRGPENECGLCLWGGEVGERREREAGKEREARDGGMCHFPSLSEERKEEGADFLSRVGVCILLPSRLCMEGGSVN